MTSVIPPRIGAVSIKSLGQDDRTYVDDAEPELLRIFTSDDPESQVNKALKSNPSWPLYYHLAKARRNVVSWIDFKKNSTILEVGAGCGSITEELVSKDVRVVANDISWKRCEINAHRNKNAENLEIIVGNLEKYKPAKKFDYVVCVGVLEYAASFISGDNPYSSFISYLKSFLKPGGKLILAIENKLGHKYITGAREDHTGKVFDGLNNYLYTDKRVRTFGRKELEQKLGNKFRNIQFYYPYPDYKLPQSLYSDRLFPGNKCSFPLGILPTPTQDLVRYNIFNEKSFVRSLEKNNLYRDFSNSFIVIASDQSIEQNTALVHFQSHRNKKNRVITTVIQNNSSLSVQKTAASDSSVKKIDSIMSSYQLLRGKMGNEIKLVEPIKKSTHTIEMEYIEGANFEELFVNALLEKDTVKAAGLLSTYIDKVRSIPSKSTNPASQQLFKEIFGTRYNYKTTASIIPIDMNFDNFIIDESGKWHFFDYEWVYELHIPIDYVITRTLFWELLVRFSDLLAALATHTEHKTVKSIKIPLVLYEPIKKYLSEKRLEDALATEESFQEYVTGEQVDIDSMIKIAPKTDIEQLTSDNELYRKNQAELKSYTQQATEMQNKIVSYESELAAIKNSRGYSLLEKARRLKKLKF